MGSADHMLRDTRDPITLVIMGSVFVTAYVARELCRIRREVQMMHAVATVLRETTALTVALHRMRKEL